MTSRRLAALDLGTNSARLAVADVDASGALHLVADERIPCRLGADLARTGALAPDAELRALQALDQLVRHARAEGALRLAAVATYALRRASNGADFAARVRRELGLELRILSGAEEADLVFLSARRHAGPGPLVSLDLGGGSLELARATPAGPHCVSLELGAVLLAADVPVPTPPAIVHALERRAQRSLLQHAAEFAGSAPEPVAAGGTVTAAARLLDRVAPLSGQRLDLGELERQKDRLAPLDLPARRGVPRLDPDRADIIVPGLAVLVATLRFLGAGGLRVHAHGIREGVLLAMLAGKL